MMCLQGLCEGDSGGPLYIDTVYDDDEFRGQTLAGIHSGGGGGCGHENFPNWWTRVATYVPWILCVKANAEKNLSKIQIWRHCYHYTAQ